MGVNGLSLSFVTGSLHLSFGGGLPANVMNVITAATAKHATAATVAKSVLLMHGALFGLSPVGLAVAAVVVPVVAVTSAKVLTSMVSRRGGRAIKMQAGVVPILVMGMALTRGVSYATSRVRLAAGIATGRMNREDLFKDTHRQPDGNVARWTTVLHVTRNIVLALAAVYATMHAPIYLIPLTVIVAATFFYKTLQTTVGKWVDAGLEAVRTRAEGMGELNGRGDRDDRSFGRGGGGDLLDEPALPRGGPERPFRGGPGPFPTLEPSAAFASRPEPASRPTRRWPASSDEAGGRKTTPFRAAPSSDDSGTGRSWRPSRKM